MKVAYTFLAILCLALAGCKKDDASTADNTANSTAGSTAGASTAGSTSASTDTKSDAAQNDITGQWTGMAEPGDVKMTYDIKADTLTQSSESLPKGQTEPLKSEMEATYKVDGDKMSVKATKMHLSTDDPKSKDAIEKSNAMFTDELLAKTPAQEWTLEWKDKDNLVITSTGPQGKITTTLKRGG